MAMNRRSAFTAAEPMPGTSSGAAASSHTVSPVVLEWPSSRLIVVVPIPRRGELTIRVNAPVSWWLTRTFR